MSALPANTPELDAWLRPERFEYSLLGERWAALRLLASVQVPAVEPQLTDATLIVRRGTSLTSHASFSATVDRPEGAAEELLWRVSFGLPLEVVEYPGALFELTTGGGLGALLPAPILAQAAERSRGLPRRLIALASALTLTLSSTVPPGSAAVMLSRPTSPAVLRCEQLLHRQVTPAQAAAMGDCQVPVHTVQSVHAPAPSVPAKPPKPAGQRSKPAHAKHAHAVPGSDHG